MQSNTEGMKNHTLFYGGIIMLLCVILPGILFSSCSGDKKVFAPAVEDPKLTPMMHSVGVSTLISDSGVIRYKIIAEEWKVYDKLDTSKWTFEKGIYVEQYNDSMHIEAKIKADTAYYYDKLELWDLRGHVNIVNNKGEKFNTEQLFWNQKEEKVYSDRFIRIQQIDKILTGYGFNSDQEFTDYIIRNTAGIFPIEDQPANTQHQDSIRS